ncbi:MAG: tetratricopeptide repeat protein [Anaerolineae bacterium]|jgi:tetratricopeptide (TPR) repeat protein|nr:tetratricopeptide repeat protein [Anaerolineae bacterium]
MGHVIIHIIKRFRLWDKPTQSAFIMTLILAIPALILSVAGDETVRGYAVMSLMASLFVAQLIFLWANRDMINDYTRAQRHFMRGEFGEVITILKAHLQNKPKDVQAMTLLGNAYRQLGDLEASHAVLLEAIDIQPMNYFPLYGFGRTLLVAGQFSQALATFQKALKAGGHAITYFDIGEAAYFGGDFETAREALKQGLAEKAGDENRVWLAQVLLHHLDKSPFPSLTDATRTYWTTQANLFENTPYGGALKTLLAGDSQS